jgi:hypothetical protein
LGDTQVAFSGEVMHVQQHMTHEDLDVVMAVIGLVLPGMNVLNMTTTPLLPPVVVPRADWSEGSEYTLYLGDMLVQNHDGEVTDDTGCSSYSS